MKVWTQSEFDALKAGLDGHISVPTGDWTQVDFRKKQRLIIAPFSMLGDNVQLGASCAIGHHCTIGDDFRMDVFGTIGRCCQFGKRAKVGAGSLIGGATHFGEHAEIGNETEIGDHVEFGAALDLFGEWPTDPASIVKIAMGDRANVYAFKVATGDIYVYTQHALRTLEEFKNRGLEMATRKQFTNEDERTYGREMVKTADFVRELYAARAQERRSRQTVL